MRSRRLFSSAPGPRVPLFALVILAAALGCREDAQAPTAPESEPTLATAATTPALSFRQISAGAYHACGVTTDDRAYCWGSNFSGELGNGTNSGPETCFVQQHCSTRPVAVAGGLRFSHVSAGSQFTCGITTEKRAYCWGTNGVGELGDGTTTDRLTPVAVAGGRSFRLIRAGGAHTCALTTSGVAFCWGYNASGQLGDRTTIQRLTPVRVAGGLTWRQLSGGANHTCGVTTADRAYCWGSNLRGQLGTGSNSGPETCGTMPCGTRPISVSGGRLFRQIEAGVTHTCAVASADDRAYCWGTNFSGELGDGTTTRHWNPIAVVGARRFDHVNAGLYHTCGVTLTGRGFCWGANEVGQLGDGTTIRRLAPTRLSVDLDLTQVTAGLFHSCGVTTGDRAYCWGENFYGQLGDGSTTDRSTPGAVAGPM
jgi:alpha-tubulin suppressor-like RCC1 family protein